MTGTRASCWAAAAILCWMAPSSQVLAENIVLKEVGSFHVGGRKVTVEGLPAKEVAFSPGSVPFKVDPNGDYQTGQMYVQYYKQAAPKAKYPLLLWHGGGLTGVSWETKPDGRPGFQDFFLRAGHDLYVSDSAERGRSSFSRTPEVYKTEPQFRTANEAWSLFRFGPNGSYGARKTFDGVQFPVDQLEQFGKQGVARWLDSDAMIQAAYDALIDKICPCVVMTHSQGGLFGFNAALRAPDKIKALISLEPGTPPPAQKVDDRVKGIPFLVVWGDFIDQSAYWTQKVPPIRQFTDALAAHGGRVDWVDLPKIGIKGNTHMLMMDKNSEEIATLVQKWMISQGLAAE